MSRNRRGMEKDLLSYPVPDFDRERMEATVRLVRKAYSERLLTKRTGFLKLAAIQARFIGRWVWIAQAAFIVLFLVFAHMNHIERHGLQRLFFIFSALAPMIAFLIVPELLKSHVHGMEEIESSTRFSIQKLFGARMLIIGLADLFCLTMIIAAAAAGSGADFLRLGMYLFVPFNLTCCGCLTVLDRVKSRYSGYYCGLLCLVFAIAFARLSLVPKLYEASATGVWTVMFALSAAYLAVEVARTVRHSKNILSRRENLSVAW